MRRVMTVARRMTPLRYRALHNIDRWGTLPYIRGLDVARLESAMLVERVGSGRSYRLTGLGRAMLEQERKLREQEGSR